MAWRPSWTRRVQLRGAMASCDVHLITALHLVVLLLLDVSSACYIQRNVQWMWANLPGCDNMRPYSNVLHVAVWPARAPGSEDEAGPFEDGGDEDKNTRKMLQAMLTPKAKRPRDPKWTSWSKDYDTCPVCGISVQNGKRSRHVRTNGCHWEYGRKRARTDAGEAVCR